MLHAIVELGGLLCMSSNVFLGANLGRLTTTPDNCPTRAAHRFGRPLLRRGVFWVQLVPRVLHPSHTADPAVRRHW